MFRAVFVLWAMLALPIFAEHYDLVKSTDYWRVQVAAPDGSQPVEAWKQVSYNDSAWPLQQASFSNEIATGIGAGEQTQISLVTTGAVCFRRSFVVADPKFVQWLTLRIDYQSGFVAYLNGTEIARRNFPDLDSKPVPLTARPAFHPPNATEWIDVTAAAALLRTGTNVLAIQLHNSYETDLLLATELLANFLRGPFVQNTTTNSTVIAWQTMYPTTGLVVYGPDTEHLFALPVSDTNTSHGATLTGLNANQSYIYRIYAQRRGEVVATDWSSFRTAKPPGEAITFITVGDSGVALGSQYNIANQIAASGIDLMVHLGDLVYPCWHSALVDERFFSIYRDKMITTPFYACVGNHEYYCGQLGDYLRSFYFPTNSMNGSERYYSFDNGDAHFVVLATDYASGERYYPGSPQYNWLEYDLATSKQRWKFLFFHHVYRSSSFHSNADSFTGQLDMFALRASIGVLAEKYGAQVIFNGHDHDYERFNALNGVTSMVLGGGGAGIYFQQYKEPGSMQFYSQHSFARVTVQGPELKLEAVDQFGRVFDRLYISQTSGGPQPFDSTWGSPQVETTAGSGLDGNTPGQTFDFAGPSIPTAVGVSANLGRLHVRNDSKYFYFGFEDAAIWTNQVIAVFLENPALPGIADLGQLGDNQLDVVTNSPQGADGLDMLQKLGFTNFRPSIGCLLGDEFADGTVRDFKRPGAKWGTGQGVFRLDQSFTSIAGARVQQFNRSPQGAPVVFPESNADFIEVAVPLSEFGAPPGPAQIRIGAIVFSVPDDGSPEPQIDTAYAGASLLPQSDGSMKLEPVTIQLAGDPDPFHDGFEFHATQISETTLRFDWVSAPPANYMIQWTPRLGEEFQDLNVPGLPLTATGPTSTFTLPIEPNQSGFFRLRAN